MYNDLIIKKLVVCSEIFKKMQNHQMERGKTPMFKLQLLDLFSEVQILEMKPLS